VGQIADHARKTADPVAEGAHARAQHFEVEALGKLLGPAVKRVQLLKPVSQQLLANGCLTGQFAKLVLRARGQAVFVAPLAQIIQLLRQLGLVAF